MAPLRRGEGARILDVAEGDRRLLLPMAVGRERGLRILRLIGHGPADQLGPIGDLDLVPDALRALQTVPDWDVARFDLVPGRIPLPTGAVALVEEEASPVLEMDGTTWEEYLDSRGGHFRSRLRYRERRLARRGVLEFRLTRDPAQLDADLDILFALHRARWPRSDFGQRESFHREFAGIAHARGWLRLWICLVDGTPIAATYGFRYAGSEGGYQAGRDPAWDRDGVGSLIILHSIREAWADEVRAFRFLRGGEDFKWRLATGDEGLRTVAIPRSALGRAAVAGWVAGARIRRASPRAPSVRPPG